MSKQVFAIQFDQSLNIFEEVVKECSEVAWLNSGCGYMVPARVAFHTLLGVEYYIEYKSELSKRFGKDWENADELPAKNDILNAITELRAAAAEWITRMEPHSENTRFPWAGKSTVGILIFLLRHTMYHTGELNALVYQDREGGVDDLWMRGFKESE